MKFIFWTFKLPSHLELPTSMYGCAAIIGNNAERTVYTTFTPCSETFLAIVLPECSTWSILSMSKHSPYKVTMNTFWRVFVCHIQKNKK